MTQRRAWLLDGRGRGQRGASRNHATPRSAGPLALEEGPRADPPLSLQEEPALPTPEFQTRGLQNGESECLL